MDYFIRFIDAIKRTESWGLDSGDITLNRSLTHLNEESKLELLNLYNNHVKDFSGSESASCVLISDALVSQVQDLLCTDAYLTIGNVHNKDIIYYECTEKYLYELLTNHEIDRAKIKVHAWITLSSGEIVDFTFIKGHALKSEWWEQYNDEIIVGDPMKSKFELAYFPLIVGDDYLFKSGVKVWKDLLND